jgi:MFS family permease
MIPLYGSEKNVRRNLLLFFIDGISFMPSMTLISITTVIPFFLEYLGASTFQIAMAASIALICTIIAQPLFGSMSSRTKKLHRTFGKILFTQRIGFFLFILSIPLFAGNPGRLIWIFLFFWGVFNLFVGSYGVFFVPLVLKLLPPDKRGTLRGIGFAIGSGLGLLMAALIPVILNRADFPYNFMVIFMLGCVFLFLNAAGFLLMKEHDDITPREPMSVTAYIKGIVPAVSKDAPFRSMLAMSMFLVVANSLLAFYTLYAMRELNATEYHVATLAALAVAANAVGFVVFGLIIDRFGPAKNAVIAALLLIAAGGIALAGSTLVFLYAAWIFANMANSAYGSVASLLIGEVAPSNKLPLYAGALNIVSLALSSVVLLVLAPAVENIGFGLIFIVVLGCGAASLVINIFVFNKHLTKIKGEV